MDSKAWARRRAVGRYYERLQGLVNEARIKAALRLLRLPRPFKAVHLGQVQLALYNDLRVSNNWIAPDEPRHDLRNAIMNKAGQLAAFLGNKGINYHDVPFWATVQCFGVLDRLVTVAQQCADDLDPYGVNRLHGMVESAMVRAATKPCAISDQSLQIIEDVVRRCRRTLLVGLAAGHFDQASEEDSRESRRQAILRCSDRTVVAIIAAPMVVAEPVNLPPDEADKLTKIWTYTKFAELVSREIFQAEKTFSDVYLPNTAGDILVAASSLQPAPGPPPNPFSHRLIARGCLQGGAAILTRSFLPNDNPCTLTNSHHEAEGEPNRALSIPIETDREGRSGQMFIGIKGPGPAVAQIPNHIRFLLSLGDCLSEELTGRPPEFRWHGYLQPVQGFDAFRNRLEDIWKGTQGGPDADHRTAFVVVASRCEGLKEEAAKQINPVLDNWTRFASQRLAGGEPIYRLNQDRAYVFVKANLDDAQWRDLRDKRQFNPEGLIELFCPDGAKAGFLGAWAVMWRHDVLLRAKGALEERLVQLIEAQVEIAAEAMKDINELQSYYERADYEKALLKGKQLVMKYGSDCGVVINECIRLALLKEDFKTALEYSMDRLRIADWDPEAHANYVGSLLAMGRIQDASAHLHECPTCQMHQQNLESRASSKRLGNLQLGLMLGFVHSLEPLTPQMHYDLRREIRACLEQLSVNLPFYRERVRQAIDEVQSYLLGQRERSTPEPLLNDILLSFFEAETARDGRLRHWGEVAALRRIVTILRALVHAVRAGEARPPSSDSSLLKARSVDRQRTPPSSEDED